MKEKIDLPFIVLIMIAIAVVSAITGALVGDWKYQEYESRAGILKTDLETAYSVIQEERRYITESIKEYMEASAQDKQTLKEVFQLLQTHKHKLFSKEVYYDNRN